MLGANKDGRLELDDSCNHIFVYFHYTRVLINGDTMIYVSRNIIPGNWAVLFQLGIRSCVNNHVLLELITNSVGLSNMIVPQMRLTDLEHTIIY